MTDFNQTEGDAIVSTNVNESTEVVETNNNIVIAEPESLVLTPIRQLLASNAPVRTDGFLTYPSPRDMFNQMAIRFQAEGLDLDELPCEVKMKAHKTSMVGDNNEMVQVYDRYSMQFTLPQSYDVTVNGDRHSSVIGLVAAMDTDKPYVKFYQGNQNQGNGVNCCLNMSVFSATQIEELSLATPGFFERFNVIGRFFERIEENNREMVRILTEWDSVTYEGDQLNMVLGQLMRKIKSNRFSLITHLNTMVSLLESPLPLKVGNETFVNFYYNEDKRYTRHQLYQMMTVGTTRGTVGSDSIGNTLQAAQLFMN